MTSVTRELENLKKLESVGFSHEQAKTLAKVVEKPHLYSHESLKKRLESLDFDHKQAEALATVLLQPRKHH